RRDRSNTPLQALTLLNDAVFVEMADTFGGRIIAEGGTDDAGRIAYAMELCLARPASEDEAARMQAYLDDRRRSGTDEARLWPEVAGILLNLHEFITRD